MFFLYLNKAKIFSVAASLITTNNLIVSQVNTANTFSRYFSKFVPFKQRNVAEKCLTELFRAMEAGHVCWNMQDEDALLADALRPEDLEQLPALPLFGNAEDKRPFVLEGNKMYLQRYHAYETQLLRNILKLAEYSAQQQINDFEEELKKLFPMRNLQMAAAITALVQQFCIITGGPGTGKTTSVAKLLALLYGQNRHLRVLLAAPTGKAAVRLAESLSNIEFAFLRESIEVDKDILAQIKALKPTTIHTLLGYKSNSIYFKHHAGNPLPADVLIIDECSMIDMALFAKLTNAVAAGTKLVLLGDKNQLASVEAGSVFGDLCNSVSKTNSLGTQQDALMKHFEIMDTTSSQTQHPEPLSDHLIELKESHRFKDGEGIGRFSKAVIEGDFSAAARYYEPVDPKVQLQDHALPDLQSFVKNYLSYIHSVDIVTALLNINDAKILCAFREGKTGIHAMNQQVETILAEMKVINPKGTFYEHKMIMVTKNQPEHGIFNGDIGIVRYVEGQLRVCFLDANKELIRIAPANIQSFETAYAITIHKSQGSEFKKVLVMMPSTEGAQLLTRELLYTAVTRAKEEASIYVQREALELILQKQVRRISGIKERLQQPDILLT